MPDFSSALYLGMSHPSASMQQWQHLTSGKPAALTQSALERSLCERAAKLIGSEAACLARSTLHIYMDLLNFFSNDPIALFVDEHVYPVAQWGAQFAGIQGCPLITFAHHDISTLDSSMNKFCEGGRRPVVLIDGYCPGCGTLAPVSDILALVEYYNGCLIVDDTQALGILGSPHQSEYWGKGGGGSLRFREVISKNLLVVNSLAKAFGVPAACISGPDHLIRCYRHLSATRIHCSHCDTAALHALSRALCINHRFGENLRRRLFWLILYFRRLMSRLKIKLSAGYFPVQTLLLDPTINILKLHRQLQQHTVRTVMHARRCKSGVSISLILTANHTVRDLQITADALELSLTATVASQ